MNILTLDSGWYTLSILFDTIFLRGIWVTMQKEFLIRETWHHLITVTYTLVNGFESKLKLFDRTLVNYCLNYTISKDKLASMYLMVSSCWKIEKIEMGARSSHDYVLQNQIIGFLYQERLIKTYRRWSSVRDSSSRLPPSNLHRRPPNEM